MRAARALFVLVSVAVACSGDAFLGPSAPKDNAAVFDQVWTTFDRHYSFFELKDVDWAAIGDRYRPLAVASPNSRALADVIARMLSELRDVHVALTPRGTGATIRFLSPADTSPAWFTSQSTVGSATSWRLTSGTHVRFGVADAGVGYICIQSFQGNDWDAEVDEALRGLGGVSALIVDVRNNAGGSVQLAVRIAGRFAQHRRTYSYVRIRNGPSHSDFTDFRPQSVSPAGSERFTGRVYVLTDRRTASSAEDFVLAMRTIENATIIGDTTRGASGAPVVRELSNGWTFQLSEWIEYTPDRQLFEDVGLAPHVFVSGSVSLSAPYRDAAYDAAVGLARRAGR